MQTDKQPRTLLITTQAVDLNHPILGFFHGWILEFSKHFDEVHVICQVEGEHTLPPHVHVYSLGKERGSVKFVQLLRFYRYFATIFFRVRPTYVFYHMGAIYNILGAPFFLIRGFFGTKFYWWKTHGHISTESRIALLFVDRVYTAIAASFPVQSPKRTVVGHAIDTTLFTEKEEPVDSLRLLFIGRRSRSKRLEQVVAIAAELLARNVDVTLTIIGAAVDVEYEAHWQQPLRGDAALQRRVTIIDAMRHDELVSAYQQAAIFLNPSDNDGLDKVVLEAMACGTIPLTANRSFATVLDQWGLFMRKGDIAQYAGRIEELWQQSPAQRHELGHELRAYVAEQHSLYTITERLFPVH